MAAEMVAAGPALRAFAVMLATAATVRGAPCGGGASEWIDPDTPAEACAKVDSRGNPLELVFSDEFETAGRAFGDGHDPRWTAMTGFPDGNEQVNAYDDSPQFATTSDGMLKMKVEHQASVLNYTNYADESLPNGRGQATRQYTTSMLQTWNKFCFSQGVVELSAKLPGYARQAGIWPAFWIFGNLGRATLKESTNRLWPFSYSQCPDSSNVEANQDPLSSQRLNACLGRDFTDQYGLNEYQGRGAIEIDIIEAWPGNESWDYDQYVERGSCSARPSGEPAWRVSQPFVATSLQLSPGIPHGADQRPPDVDAGAAQNCLPDDWDTQWYKALQPGNPVGLTYGSDYNSTVNVGFWGDYFENDEWELQTDSMSALNELPDRAFTEQMVYTLEWFGGEDGWVRFELDGKLQYQVNASTVRANMEITEGGDPIGELLGRIIPVESSYLILNIDLSTRWGWPWCPEDQCSCCTDCGNPECLVCMVDGPEGSRNVRAWMAGLCEELPATYDIDWVRVYQKEGTGSVGCSTAEFPTEGWIESHRESYVAINRDEPLRPVLAGGQPCGSDSECGAPHGSCDGGACACEDGWTGPRCLVPRIGSSATCQALETALVGGGACNTSSGADCGAGAGAGECLEVPHPWNFPRQALLMADGSEQLAGAGDGRCRCAAGRAGPHCGEALADSASPRHCAPDPAMPGAQLEELITRICSQGNSTPRHPASAGACDAVLWAPHWEAGGEHSVCGAFPRAAWVVQATMQDTGFCCSSLADCTVADLVAAGHYEFGVSEDTVDTSDGECSFLRADYGDKSEGVDACAWATLEGLVAPAYLLSNYLDQEWYSESARANTRNASVESPSQCQEYCAQVASCGFFTWSSSDQACFLKADMDCALVESFTPAAGLYSGPRKSCVVQQGDSLQVWGDNSTTSTPTSPSPSALELSGAPRAVARWPAAVAAATAAAVALSLGPGA